MSTQIQLRRGTDIEWAAVNPILAQAEIGVEYNTSQFKVGDGLTHWNSLPYGGFVGPRGAQGFPGPPGSQGPPGLTTFLVQAPLHFDPNTNTLSIDVQSVTDGANF